MINKKNFKEVIERNKAFLKRQLTDGILLNVTVENSYTAMGSNPYQRSDSSVKIKVDRDTTWKERECLSISDREWVIEYCKREMAFHSLIDDDTIPKSYPTLHFGESIYGAMLGAKIKFVGTELHTCSGAEPIINCEEDLKKLKIDENNYYIKAFKDAATYFAEQVNGEFALSYFISIDALNLAVELMGTTEAYINTAVDEELVRKVMDFGVDYNLWFYKFQKEIYEKNNRKALMDDELYDLNDKAWYSIDAYTICNPDLYDTLGYEYQQKLVSTVGGGYLHTHGTGIFGLFPKVVKLKGLGSLQVGRDLKIGEVSRFIELDKFQWFRDIAQDIPLIISVSKEEFLEGIRKRTLPGGTTYITQVDNIEEANKMATIAKEYRVPRYV